MMTAVPLLELHGITKRFGALTALSDLSFHIGEGEVIGLLGDNGAGKSTTVNLISGIHKPTSGHLAVDGKQTLFTCRTDSAEAGIETIYQNTALVDDLSITRNIFMGRERTNALGFLRESEMREIAMDVLKSAVHISGIDSPDKLVGDLSGGQKQAVAIARAVYFKRRVLLLDEPTSALSVRETEALLGQVLKLKSENVSSVLVTHNIYHAYQVCDRFVIMSHGTKVFDVAKADTDIAQLTEYVVLT
jgi:simple sugar transport system ATP-binding protein|tara:strand:- start:12545 stop:13285 length:741 start_codon:yes stop_codon:yes gene_type:complete